MVQDRFMTCPPPIATQVLLTASMELGRSGQTLRPLFASRAFSDEADAGSSPENALKQRVGW
jgi:hypothetical protein